VPNDALDTHNARLYYSPMDAPIYWTDGTRFYEFEAGTNAGLFAWYRRLDTDESVRLRVATLKPVSDLTALARAELGA
jgi:hypothetical protein